MDMPADGFMMTTIAFFDYCLRCFPVTSEIREKGLELIRSVGYENADISIRYITGNDDYAAKEAAKNQD